MNRKDAIELAIQNEILAQNLYTVLSKSFKDHDSSTMFAELITLESIHEEKLRKVFAREFPHEALKVDTEVLPFVKIGNVKEPKEVLEFAISREIAAHNTYYEMAEQSTEPDLKQLLLQLAAEEEAHKELLQTEITRIQGGISWFDPSELTGLMED